MLAVRDHFTSLSRIVDDTSCVYLDGPAGTQVPDQVIDAMSEYYRTSNANSHGYFTNAQETDEMIERARIHLATFLGAEGGHNISLGQNMTTLNYSLARATGRYFNPGDEILITQLDHEANRGPWLSLADQGIIIREIPLLPSGRLDYKHLELLINDRTRLVCIGWSSNILGTINDIQLVRELSHKVGAWLLVDAVHYAPHFRIDVQSMDIDFLLCSAYKFYGPHVGILYARTGLLDRLPTDRLRTTEQHAPYSIETGTLNHAAIQGVIAAIDWIASLGQGTNLSERLDTALSQISRHENDLGHQLYDGLKELSNVHIVGPEYDDRRAPTISFYHGLHAADDVSKHLGHAQIYSWSGHFYAIRAVEILGYNDKGGVTRLGISAYTNEMDIKRVLERLYALK